MSHSVHPFSHRLGYIRDWKSRWFRTSDYVRTLEQDILLREWLAKRLRPFMIASVDIERSRNACSLIIKTPRPGLIIGRGGEGIESLKKGIQNKFNLKDLKITIEEVRVPFANASVVARMIAQDLEKRLPFRRVLKQNIEKVINTDGVEGVRIRVSGRLDGAEMGRKEWLKSGRIPLQTLRADIDFARERAVLPYGTIGVKVWIYRGEIFTKMDKKPEK